MSKKFSDAREARKQVFLNTKKIYEMNHVLVSAVKSSIERHEVVLEADKVEDTSDGCNV